jgi:mono/diheme cytochrome c family protein
MSLVARRTKITAIVLFVLMPGAAADAASDDKSSSPKPITYSNQVVRILQNRCQACHRPGQIGPFSLLDYDGAKNWAETIKEVVTERRMPPWFADPKFGKFANDRSLTDQEIETITKWIDAGCPKGDDRDLPEPRKFAESWFIGEPDVTFTMKEEFQVPASGTVPYRYFAMPTNFEEDKWIESVELKAGNPAVVHHILMSVREPGSRAGPRPRDGATSDEQALGFFAALAPGYVPTTFPKGFGKKIPKGATIVFQMHYTPNGTAQPDRSSVALRFAREPVHTEVRTRGIFNSFFAIPPGDPSHEVKAAFRFPQDSVVLSFMPHMHLRGKDFEYEVQYPDGRNEKVLSVPRWDFNWQVHYELAEPMIVPKGTKLACTAHFDNSADNKANPDPTKRVTWGDQTWDEMMIGYINYYVPKTDPTIGSGGN